MATLDITINNFATNGFAVVEKLASKSTVEKLLAAYHGLLGDEHQGNKQDRYLGGLTRQIMNPHTLNPVFENNEAIDNARRIAAGLMEDGEPQFLFSMAIYKPAGHPHTTPWHQDMSYISQPTSPPGITIANDTVLQFWLALVDVSEDMGCMEFIPNVHEQPMPEHYVASGEPEDEGRLLAIVDPDQHVDLSTAVRCPLKAGDATVHGYATPHFTGPNRSVDKDRPAFIFSFLKGDAPEH